MRTFRRRTRIDAPLDVVWEFHSTPAGLRALTPDWLHLQVDSVHGPDGDHNPPVLSAGSQLELSIRPFGHGPRRRWTSRIVAREYSPSASFFTDELSTGPIRHWAHTHSFFADGSETVLLDEIEYGLACGPATGIAERCFGAALEQAFRRRHARTADLLDGRTATPDGYAIESAESDQ